MFFRNLSLLRIEDCKFSSPNTLAEQLSRYAFQACGTSDACSAGWIAPQGDGALVHAVNRQWLLALGMEQKILPSIVIKEETAKRAEAFEASQGYRPGRKQTQEIREQVTLELLPRAFSRRSTTYVWIDPVNHWLAIDGNASRTEAVLSALSKAVEGLVLRKVATQQSPAKAMADWLCADEPPANFTLDQECELRAPDAQQSTVKYSRHNLDQEDVREHIASGKLPTRLAMTWNDRISFVLTDRHEIKRLSFLDILKENAQEKAANTEELFDIEFTLMTGELAKLLSDLFEALGGEITSES